MRTTDLNPIEPEYCTISVCIAVSTHCITYRGRRQSHRCCPMVQIQFSLHSLHIASLTTSSVFAATLGACELINTSLREGKSSGDQRIRLLTCGQIALRPDSSYAVPTVVAPCKHPVPKPHDPGNATSVPMDQISSKMCGLLLRCQARCQAATLDRRRLFATPHHENVW